ncbi:MAG: ParB N-terminal domain-containing protein [Phycisphaerales bacterium]|nr:ParB N-terminal domain-containing protein [Phycisphaerales bacterium]
MNIEMWSIDRIKPYDRNPRDISERAVAAVAESIRNYGWRVPVVVDGGGVLIAGHTRLLAARRLGLTEVPVHVARELTAEQAKAFRVADNKLHELTAWNLEQLAVELGDLQAMDVDLEALGFTVDELAQLFDVGVKDGLTDPDAVPDPPDEATTQRGDIWVLGDHRLMCGDSSSAADVDRLLGTGGSASRPTPIHLANTDPPYNVKVEPRSNNAIAAGNSSFSLMKSQSLTQAVDAARGEKGLHHHQAFDVARQGPKQATHAKLRPKDRPLANDFVSDEEFDRLLAAWFGNIARVLEPGRAFYIWGGYANVGNYPPVLKATGLYFSQAIIWDKQHPVLTRKDYMGAHEWCQPAGTQVETPDGPVPICSLREGDRVIGYSRNHHAMVGLREGLAVRPTARPYQGTMHGVRVGGKTTWCTPGHLWSTKLSPVAESYWCVYVMRRGDWWRVGKSKLLSTWGFGVKHRLKTEGGEEAWILTVHPSNVEATIMEQVMLAEYGIPTTTWSESASSRRTVADVGRLYDRLDLKALQSNALRLLADHGRSAKHPFVRVEGTKPKISRRVSTLTRGCNLLPEVMMVPVPERGQAVRWSPIDAVERCAFDGDVYSMDVDRYRHYVADGLVTHNCFYGWREGAAHVYLGPNNATDLWHIKKVNPQSMVHLTEKPVELAVRAMQYSSRPGENVLDLFGGSGSTLIAAEQTGRRAFLMELDALYADVIVQRWERFTGRKAERHG